MTVGIERVGGPLSADAEEKSLKIWPFPPAPLCVSFSITGLQYLSDAFSIIILRRNGCIHYQNAFHKKKKI